MAVSPYYINLQKAKIACCSKHRHQGGKAWDNYKNKISKRMNPRGKAFKKRVRIENRQEWDNIVTNIRATLTNLNSSPSTPKYLKSITYV